MKEHNFDLNCKFEFPANPEYFNCEDANDEVDYGSYEDVMSGFTEEYKEVTNHINMNNYSQDRDELGYTDKQYGKWKHDCIPLTSFAPKLADAHLGEISIDFYNSMVNNTDYYCN